MVQPDEAEWVTISSSVSKETMGSGCIWKPTLEAEGYNDVLVLSINGEKTVEVARSVLTYAVGSNLAEMFSRRWDDSLPKTKDGYFHIKYEPEIFSPLLKHLVSLTP